MTERYEVERGNHFITGHEGRRSTAWWVWENHKIRFGSEEPENYKKDPVYLGQKNGEADDCVDTIVNPWVHYTV